MALTQDQIQGVLGEFKPVLDKAIGDFTQDNIQGVLGEFKPVIDYTAGVPEATENAVFFGCNF